MKKLNALIVLIILVLILVFIGMYSYKLLILFLVLLIVLEIALYFLVDKLREDFQWLITPKDELPELSEEGLKKFMVHGYDPELGWVRKPNTKKKETGKFGITEYSINGKGARSNPGHEELPMNMSFYGDSFAFCRQVNDNETMEWHISELSKSNVLNFSVGNYGLDQALLRLKREYPKNRAKVVVMGVVPSTIVRVLCVWKHYNEFGNTFGFKPRFVVKGDGLELIKNPIDTEDKFNSYKDYLSVIREHDYFYKAKFKREMISFPYLVSVLSDPLRNIPLISLVSWHKWFKKSKEEGGYPSTMKVIMKINLILRYKLFKANNNAVNLMEKLVEEFAAYGKKEGFTPVFLWMPQKDDLSFIRKRGSYYGKFIERISKVLPVIDLTGYLIDRDDLDDVYSDDNQYGGHYSKIGNKLIAGFLYKEFKEKGL